MKTGSSRIPNPFHCPFLGTDLNGILNPFQTIERTHLLSVSSSHCSTKWANLPLTGMSGRGRTGSGKGWTSAFCGRWGLLRGGELFLIPASLCILFPIWWIWLCLDFRPERLLLLRPRKFSRLLWSFKSRRSQVGHFLLLLHCRSNWGSCQEPLLLGLKMTTSLILLPNSVLRVYWSIPQLVAGILQ